MRVEFLPPSSRRWPQAAAFIATIFAQHHGARISLDPLTLAVITGREGGIIAAAGIRGAEEGFFSQIYLDQPVAEVLSALGRGPVTEEEILEVVALAALRPAATLPLIDGIIEDGRRRGKTWGLFTATRRLADMLARTGSPLQRLAPAQAARIGDPARWGRYYETDPWVCALPDRGAAPLHLQPAGRVRAVEAHPPCI